MEHDARRDAHGVFDYRGPAELLPAIRTALAWVRDTTGTASILAAGRVRHVSVDSDGVRVWLALPPGPLLRVVLEDVQQEVTDHLQGRRSVVVVDAGGLSCGDLSRRGSPPGCPSRASPDR